jgi:hypothetical protein
MFQSLFALYRPVRSDKTMDNFVLALTVIIGSPLLFLKPIWMCFKPLMSEVNKYRLDGFIIAVLNLILAPLIILYAIVLPFLGCRLYLHSPAAQTLRDIEQMIKASNEGKSG